MMIVWNSYNVFHKRLIPYTINSLICLKRKTDPQFSSQTTSPEVLIASLNLHPTTHHMESSKFKLVCKTPVPSDIDVCRFNIIQVRRILNENTSNFDTLLRLSHINRNDIHDVISIIDR